MKTSDVNRGLASAGGLQCADMEALSTAFMGGVECWLIAGWSLGAALGAGRWALGAGRWALA